MTIAASSPVSTPSPAARVLIDARLDTIDRMLQGRLPRVDRLAIVRNQKQGRILQRFQRPRQGRGQD